MPGIAQFVCPFVGPAEASAIFFGPVGRGEAIADSGDSSTVAERSLPYRPLARVPVSDLSRELESGIPGIRDPAPGCEVHPAPIPREAFTINEFIRNRFPNDPDHPGEGVPGRRSAAPPKRAVSE
ncbi:hypothetical protein SBA4_4600011 [Candidatus Sulfopaludibacter sp. SbA4]|nr:hypothetical protein SBA4_4600011 [Candidatus Sulfopaludibacter sp. SbA4]